MAFGYVTTTVTVLDADPAQADEKLRMVERVIRAGASSPSRNAQRGGCVAVVDSGHAYANVRQPIVSTLNLAHLMPVSAVWAGPEKNAHL